MTTEALDRGKGVIGGFAPSEPFGIGVVSCDERGDICHEGGYAAIDTTSDLLAGEEREEALHLVGHDELVGVRCTCQRGRFTSPLWIKGVLCVA